MKNHEGLCSFHNAARMMAHLFVFPFASILIQTSSLCCSLTLLYLHGAPLAIVSEFRAVHRVCSVNSRRWVWNSSWLTCNLLLASAFLLWFVRMVTGYQPSLPLTKIKHVITVNTAWASIPNMPPSGSIWKP